MKLVVSQQFFEKYPNAKFHENLSSGSQVVPCGQRDVMKFIVIFPNVVDMPKKWSFTWEFVTCIKWWGSKLEFLDVNVTVEWDV